MAIDSIQAYKDAELVIKRYEDIIAAKTAMEALLAIDPNMELPVVIGDYSHSVSITARLAEFVPMLASSVATRKAEVEALGIIIPE